MMSQKEAVFAAITKFQGQGMDGDALEQAVIQELTFGLVNGDIAVRPGKEHLRQEKFAEKYAPGLLSNWTRKDRRLNGDVKYAPKTKRGPIVKDPTLIKLKSALKSLEAHGVDSSTIDRVKAKIVEQEAVVAAAKAQSTVKPLDEAMAELESLGIDLSA